MTTSKPAPQQEVRMVLLSDDAGTVDFMLEDLGTSTRNLSAPLQVSGTPVNVVVKSGIPEDVNDWKEAIESASALALVVRYMDVLSMERIQAIYKLLPRAQTTPFGIIIFRDSDETDFKMSCPYCGQKLWVRDADVNKRGRCPNCSKAYTLPPQSKFLRKQLELPDAVRVSQVTRGITGSIEGSLKNLILQCIGKPVEVSATTDP